MRARFSICVAAAALFGGSVVAAERLPGSAWAPVEVDGVPFTPLKETFVGFDTEGRVFGTGGCNRLKGMYVTNEDSILFGPVAMTMMACPEDVMKQEQSFLRSLNAARFFERNGTELTLSDAAGTLLMKLVQHDSEAGDK